MIFVKQYREHTDIGNIADKQGNPLPPIGKVLMEGAWSNKSCRQCGSSMQHKYFFFVTDKCINKCCSNYYGWGN